MSDLEIRQLEVALARTPSDLDVRQRLLQAYVRTGLLRPNELLDLASLGDAGAISLTGKTPDLNSRSKKFYLRCAWVVLLHAQEKMVPAQEFYQIAAYSAQERLTKDLDTLYNAIETFNSLMLHYLQNGDMTPSLPVLVFSPGNNASLREFPWVFKRVQDYFDWFLRSNEVEGEFPDDRLNAMHNLLTGYWLLAKGVTDKVKKNTDEAIHFAAISLAFSQGLNYWRDWNIPARRRLLQIKEGERTENDYFNRRAAELLIASRPLIIKQWLPSYTP